MIAAGAGCIAHSAGSESIELWRAMELAVFLLLAGLHHSLQQGVLYGGRNGREVEKSVAI